MAKNIESNNGNICIIFDMKSKHWSKQLKILKMVTWGEGGSQKDKRQCNVEELREYWILPKPISIIWL